MASALSVITIVSFVVLFITRQQVATLEGKNAELQKQLDEKNAEISQKADLLSQKTGEVSTLNTSLEEREKMVADKTTEIKNLTGSLTSVSTCISGLVKSSSAGDYGDYTEALRILRSVRPSCNKSIEVIKKFDKFR